MALFADYMTKWILSMSWHLWRIATLRPYFKGIGDTAMSTVSFAVVFFVFGLIRWVWFGGKNPGLVVLGLGLHFVVLSIVFERTNRSSALVLACLGASAIADALASLGAFVFETSVDSRSFSIIEYALYAFAALQFFREPKEVQANGYRRSKLDSPSRDWKK